MAGKLSPHQQRVLGALLALEQKFPCPWWSRTAIGEVVAAGGFHGTIQRSTMATLKGQGLVQTERSSWPAEIAARVRCNCGCCEWGLTALGREQAWTLGIRWPADAEERLARAGVHRLHGTLLDEDDAWKRINEAFDELDDDDPSDFWKRGS